MTVRCVSCSSFSLQRVKPELAARGFGHCKHRERFITHKAVIDRECGLYQPEQDASVVQKRNDWLKGRG
jgi:hypothetical protein